MFRLAVAFGLMIAALGVARAADAPRRIVSFNLCADQLVLALADPEQIAGLSTFAADPDLSVMAGKARPFPKLDQRSEATVALQPDLVLVGPTDRSSIRTVLTRLGLHVEEVGLVKDVASARVQVRALAARLGHPERGEALIAAIDAAQKRLHAVAGADTRTALVVERGGYTAGPDSLVVNLLREAGFMLPQGAPSGLGGFVPLERLLLIHPDVLAMHDSGESAADQGAAFLTHPALDALYPLSERLIMPRRLSLCGGPAIVAALDYLTGVLHPPALRTFTRASLRSATTTR
ncbi:MAG: ABC transporter substrate-binding protein [Variibacter sp.]